MAAARRRAPVARAVADAAAAFLVHDTLEIAVQVNGKLRGRFSAPAGSSDEELEASARALDNVAGHLDGHEVARVIVVPGKLVNFVVR